jgi:MFS family permease
VPRTAPRNLPSLDDVGRSTLRLDLTASVLGAATQAILELGPALAKKGFNATDFEVALLASGQSAGLVLSFFIAHLAMHGRKMPLVFWPETLRAVFLVAIVALNPAFAMGFVLCHAAAQVFHHMTVPARVAVYGLNYPPELRGEIVGRNRRILYLIAAGVSVAISSVLDQWFDLSWFYRLIGVDSPSPGKLVTWILPLTGILGFAGTVFFARIHVREPVANPGAHAGSFLRTLQQFFRVWWEDRDFRRYENFYLIFGFANIMTIALTQIHAVDRLHASYFDLAMINVALIQAPMALTMAFWGRLVDRHSPARLRGYINLIFSIDFLVLALAPTIGWIYAGRICRGVALGGGTLLWMLGALYYARIPERVPIYLGIHTVLTGFRWALAPFVGIWLKALFHDDARPIFFITFVIVAGSALLMIRQSRNEPPRQHPPGPPMPAPRMTGA